MRLTKSLSSRRGFTLIEILIVVVILGILAAIVIPQFANASTASKVSSVQTTAQTLRGAVQLYYYQHNDKLPPADQFWTLMTTQTDAQGNAYVVGTSTTGPFGPYVQSVPLNALNGSSTVIDAGLAPGSTCTTACAFEYEYSSGTGNGVVRGTGADFLTIVP
ncbi:MAG TPA: prepilin-type N-terminal cleavage/methylation domain-containing protein [Tepidisphaeraceae bacterium]|nr:prepilin-type N-terminal cleavage/methylation domain-containing protein [Tepidisphaeraceae bacterium]